MPDSTSTTAAQRAVGVHFDGDLRSELVDAAARLIAERGVDRLSLREVARRVGVSHAAPAHHFGDRTGLLTAVATAGFERFVVRLAAAVPDGASPVDTLLGLARGYAVFADGERGYFDVMFEPSMVDLTDPAYVAASDTAFGALRGVVVGLQSAGWHPDDDPTGLAAALWSFAHGLASLRRQGSLARHHGDGSLEHVSALAALLL